jgi:hypothetical protein
MPNWLKQSTAVDIALGPFVDEMDGKTAEAALTISQADVRLKKNGGDWVAKNDAGAAVHEENGWYEVALDATDTGTLGILKVAVLESGALPVWESYMVVPAHVYDGLVAGGDYLEVDAQQWKGATAPDMTGDAYARLGAPAGASVSADIAAVRGDTGAILADTGTDGVWSRPAPRRGTRSRRRACRPSGTP